MVRWRCSPPTDRMPSTIITMDVSAATDRVLLTLAVVPREAAPCWPAVQMVVSTDATVTMTITETLMAAARRRPSPMAKSSQQLTGLTDREVEVWTLVARGWSNQEISESLYVTSATTKTHVSRLLMKLGARDRAQLIVIAYETGLVSAG